ncbi:lipoxygenase family protein [Kitasatospora purpeofusca]|uniref:lipoxygenase family protein n=1 Tax=Kitasatospora purpeofusca TaxID=67352 RepID=UPI0022505D3D|nr:lipoxygenase family protein [Kitasatospora purpeofusca]MCX4755767.1 lipoxygenase family protein [Kitasatospora purpeofusca]WSR36374.1 hypothetical protein OG715_38740 [Kitasatospora purpeofusca]WSR44660.1 hypothetical protein OG196_39630 [Kitasatospora purpeofusca]
MPDLDRRSVLKAGLATLAAAAPALSNSAACAAPARAASGVTDLLSPVTDLLLGDLLPAGLPSPSWVAQAAPVALRAFGNAQAVTQSGRWTFERSVGNAPAWVSGVGAPTGLADLLGLYPGPVVGGDVIKTLDGYRAVFTPPQLDLPAIADTFTTEETFAEGFVAGPDPTRLVRLDAVPEKFPLTSEHLASVPELGGGELSTAIAAGRVYWVDYALTADLVSGRHGDGTPKYVYSPMIAFCVAVTGGAPRAFAIQCGQDPAGRRIYTPADGYSWRLARNCVQATHHSVHEALTHLAFTHLVIGRLMEAAAPTLTSAHPLSPLLKHHFDGTPFINSQVPVLLTAPGAWFDVLAAPTQPSMNAWIEGQLDAFSFRAAALPARLAAHGTGDTRALGHYPYRDDGLLIWNATSAWVTDFVGAFYASDAQVRADTALQAFAARVRLADFGRSPGHVEDRQDLVEILTTLVWIAGPQHAAVNFSQNDWMSYLPAAPLAGFTPEPTGTGHTEQDWLDNLPPADVALLQAGVGNLLTAVHNTPLGDYGLDFTLTRASTAAGRFTQSLIAAEREINSRNRLRARPYTYLLPSQIPKSISI